MGESKMFSVGDRVKFNPKKVASVFGTGGVIAIFEHHNINKPVGEDVWFNSEYSEGNCQIGVKTDKELKNFKGSIAYFVEGDFLEEL